MTADALVTRAPETFWRRRKPRIAAFEEAMAMTYDDVQDKNAADRIQAASAGIQLEETKL